MRKLPQAQSSISPSCGRLLERTLRDASYSEASLLNLIQSISIQPLNWSLSRKAQVTIDVLRTDLLHPKLGGNKLFKLWGYLHASKQNNTLETLNRSAASSLVSFGGAYSNHLYALAALGQLIERPTIGFIRGEQPTTPSSTLRDLNMMGMRLIYLDRALYRTKNVQSTQNILRDLYAIDGRALWIPEGGSGTPGMFGCEQLGRFITAHQKYTHVIHACGTATTLAGLVRGSIFSSALTKPTWLGISALKSDRHLVNSVSLAVQDALTLQAATVPVRWALSNQYHGGGFAKLPQGLKAFMHDFYEETAIPIDRVYTGKVFHALSHMLNRRVFRQRDRILVVHSGGLQGNRA